MITIRIRIRFIKFLLSAFATIFPLFFIRTLEVKVFWGIITFVLSFLVLFNFEGENAHKCLKVKAKSFLINVFHIIPYLMGVLASFFVLFVPDPCIKINVEPWGIANSFSSLNVFQMLRVLSAYYLVGFFPGFVICSSFLDSKEFDYVEKLGLMLALSFCFTVLTGLLLLYIKIFSISLYLLILWSLVIFLRRIFCRYKTKTENSKVNLIHTSRIRFTIGLSQLTPFIVGVIIVALSYFLVLHSGKRITVDVMEETFYAHLLVNYSPAFIRAAKYIGLATYLWVTKTMTGLPIAYAYVGIQFTHLLFPISVYTLVSSLFPNKKRIAAMATIFIFFGSGLTGLIAAAITSNSEGYIFGELPERWRALSDIWGHIAGPMNTIRGVETEHFDCLVFFALAFAYRYLGGWKHSIKNLIFLLILALTSLLTHTVFFFPVFAFTVLFYSLIYPVSIRKLAVLFGAIIGLTFLFDPISRFIFGNFWIPMLLGSEYADLLTVSIFAVLFIFLCTLLIIFRDKWAPRIVGLAKRLLALLNARLPRKLMKSEMLLILGIAIFSYAFILFILNYESLQTSRMFTSPTYFYPWYYIVIRFFGLTFPLAIASIAYLSRITRRALAFLSGFALSFLPPIIASCLFPDYITPTIWGLRYEAFLLYPLSVFASLYLSHAISKLKYDGKRVCAYALITISMTFAFLSVAYPFEQYYISGQLGDFMHAELAEALNFINKNLQGAKVLPLSDNGAKLLTAYAKDVYVLPIFCRFSPSWLPYPWVHELLVTSTPDVFTYIINKINADYIFALEGEAQKTSSLRHFPILYENSLVTIYMVPKIPLRRDSNYFLVYPTLDKSRNIGEAYNLLLNLGVNFSLIHDVDLDELKEGNVYVFPESVHVPRRLSENLLSYVRNGAHIIFLNPYFASMDELGYKTNLSIIETCPLSISVNLSALNNRSLYHSREGRLICDENEGLYAEDVERNLDFICYQYEFPSPLNLEDYTYIRIVFKKNCTGKVDFVLAAPSKPGVWWAWKGFDKRYEKLVISPSDVNKWKTIDLPIKEPTWTNGLNISDVGSLRIEIYDFDANQSVRFQIGDIKFLTSVSAVSFTDGEEYKFDEIPLEQQIIPIYKGIILANYSGDIQLPFIWHSKIGKGSLTFVNINLLRILDHEAYLDIIQHAANILSNLLPLANMSKKLYLLPYNAEVLEYLVPHVLTLRFSEGLHNIILWYDKISMQGNVTIESDKMLFAKEVISVKQLVIETDESKFIFQNATIRSLTIKGASYARFDKAEIEVVEIPGEYFVIQSKKTSYCNVMFTNSGLSFEINVNGQLKNFNFSNANVTIIPNGELELFVKQPVLAINGKIEGTAQGVIKYNLFCYTPDREYISIVGQFALELPYSSGIVYSRISNIGKITSLSGFICWSKCVQIHVGK